ncbi:IS66 family insertion sequence element accessory protein TnpA [Rhodoferax antarcticus]|uniref:IS66 family insertion sequence element accessory protein TnpA n=1 Tax=Rhodoferax antarcticus TaxID=81479 RepID=UPI000AAD1487
MQNRWQYWSQHIAAAKFEALSAGAYAKKHGLSASTLYRWQQRLSSANCNSANGLLNAGPPVGIRAAASIRSTCADNPLTSEKPSMA